jgi:hypothetical protein
MERRNLPPTYRFLGALLLLFIGWMSWNWYATHAASSPEAGSHFELVAATDHEPARSGAADEKPRKQGHQDGREHRSETADPSPMDEPSPAPKTSRNSAEAVSGAAAGSGWIPLDLDRSDEAVTRRLKEAVEYLASEELEGRGVRTKGLDLAAEYIAEEFRKAGLVTDHYQGTPFHEFRLYSTSRRGTVQKLVLEKPHGIQIPLVRGTDFTSLTSSPQGAFSYPVVFAGYGITAPELEYDDYAGIDVRGKAVIVLRHEPERHNPESRFNGTENSRYAYVRTKIKNAIERGAAAVLLCTDHAEIQLAAEQLSDDDAPPASHEIAETLLQGELNEGDVADNIPVVHVRRVLIERMIRQSLDENLAEIEARIDETLQPESRLLPDSSVHGAVQIARSHRSLRNVVASLEGTGPHAEETIVLGAHYDHLGRDGWGSLAIGANEEIHHGADDNASGTSLLMEVARQLAASPKPLGRRVLFIAFTAEELGLIGSKRYVQDPLIPLNQTIAMLNLDMVGRLREGKLTVYGAGTARQWPQMLTSAVAATDNDDLRLILRPGGYGPSDHASFYEHGIPVLHFFTGFHPQYHRPTDTADLINADGMRQITEIVTHMITELAEPNRTMERTEPESLLDLAELQLGGLSGSSGSRRRFGVQVVPVADGDGVLIRRVQTNSLAERNGMRVGDVILMINSQPVKTVDDLRSAVQESEETDEWTVKLRRRGIVAEIVVRLAS